MIRFTAAWVAGWRGLGSLLGDHAIVDDRFGARFGGAWARGLARAGQVASLRRGLIAIPGLVHWVAYISAPATTVAPPASPRGSPACGSSRSITRRPRRASARCWPTPAVLTGLGLDPAAPTLTLWEAVTMYLTEPAIEATLATVRGLGGAGSTLVLTYVERHNVERPAAATG